MQEKKAICYFFIPVSMVNTSFVSIGVVNVLQGITEYNVVISLP